MQVKSLRSVSYHATERLMKPTIEPQPLSDRPRRYSNRALPPYRFIPGAGMPHPAGPAGYMKHGEGPVDVALPPQRWREQASYLYGIDLYNLAYWWEAHEALEGIWHASDDVIQRGYVQGLIMLSGAMLKQHLHQWRGMRKLITKAYARFDQVAGSDQLQSDGSYMGLAVGDCLRRLEPLIAECSDTDDAASAPSQVAIALHLRGL